MAFRFANSRYGYGFSILFLLFSPLTAAQMNSTWNLETCFPDRTDGFFEVCQARICFLIKPEHPFVIDDTSEVKVLSNANPEHHKFDCINPPSGLTGIFFDIIKAASANELRSSVCMFAGDDCSWNNNIEYIKGRAHHTNGDVGYKLIAGGLFFFTPTRVSKHSILSVPIWDGNMVALGRRELTPRASIIKIFQPFNWSARLFVFVMFFVIFSLRICLACFFTRPANFESIREHILDSEQIGPYEKDRNRYKSDEKYESDILRYKSISKHIARTWSFGVGIIIIFLVLYYELGWIDTALASLRETIGKSLEDFTVKDMERYLLIEGGGVESMLSATTKIPIENFPQQNRIKGSDEVYDRVLQGDENLRTFRFDIESISHLIKQGKCDQAKLLEGESKLPSYTAGWYYSSDVPTETRQAINKELLELRLRNSFKKFWENHTDKSKLHTCGRQDNFITLKILWLPFTAIVGFFLIAAFVCTGWGKFEIQKSGIPSLNQEVFEMHGM